MHQYMKKSKLYKIPKAVLNKNMSKHLKIWQLCYYPFVYIEVCVKLSGKLY